MRSSFDDWMVFWLMGVQVKMYICAQHSDKQRIGGGRKAFIVLCVLMFFCVGGG